MSRPKNLYRMRSHELDELYALVPGSGSDAEEVSESMLETKLPTKQRIDRHTTHAPDAARLCLIRASEATQALPVS
jgi:hypothetical protein